MTHASLSALSSRQQAILRLLLHEKQGLTLNEIAERIGITRNAADHQLTTLEGMDYTERVKTPSTGGRPAHGFRLTDAGNHLFDKHYAMFSDLLVDMIKRREGGEGLARHMEALGHALAGQFRERIDGRTDVERIAQAAALMADVGYEADTEPDPESGSGRPLISAHNCVYHHLAADHREVCQLDLALMGDLLDADIEHTECMVRGGAACRFRIHPHEPDENT